MSESIDKQALDLVLVGAISKDENIYTDGNEKSIGGAVTYGAFSAKRSGSHVGIITKLAEEDHHLLDQFGDEQIPVWVLPSKQTTSIRNVYHSSDKESRTCTCLAAVDAFSPENLPDISTKIIHAAALINGEIPLQTLQSMTRIAEVGLDIQGFMRVCRDSKMVLEKPDELAQALKSVTYLKTDASEAEIFTNKTNLAEAALEMATMGPKEVVISHNKELVLACQGKIHRAPLTPRKINGRTGRGDTLFCSYLARRTQGDEPFQALQFAAALVSLKLESSGPFRGTLEDVMLKMTASV
ncbi:MAG: PfkB family carbohydrate kinase [Desulfobacterales bacterium]|jgi:sugar/nucleoside kinase (ribokinase family)